MPAAPTAPGVGPDTAGLSVWKPFLARAVVGALFGLVTIFWREPSALVMAIAGGLYLLLGGAAYLWTHRRIHGGARSLLTDIGGGLLLGAGIATLVFADERTFAFAGAVALAVAGLAELVRGLALKGHAAARDLVVVGVVGIATGAILPFVAHLGAHALLGVTGGGALLSTVLLAIAALSYRHDSALSAPATSGARSGADPVN
jgi:uncharacterized membrane protein HdeD (DUF308 family)